MSKGKTRFATNSNTTFKGKIKQKFTYNTMEVERKLMYTEI